MRDIMNIVKSLKDSGLLIKDVTETIGNETKKPRDRFLGKLLDTLGASLMGNMLAGNGVIRAGDEAHKAKHDF